MSTPQHPQSAQAPTGAPQGVVVGQGTHAPGSTRARRAVGAIVFWSRWLTRHAPGQAWRRVTLCRRNGHGSRSGMYDGFLCMDCGADLTRTWRDLFARGNRDED